MADFPLKLTTYLFAELQTVHPKISLTLEDECDDEIVDQEDILQKDYALPEDPIHIEADMRSLVSADNPRTCSFANCQPSTLYIVCAVAVNQLGNGHPCNWLKAGYCSNRPTPSAGPAVLRTSWADVREVNMVSHFPTILRLHN